MSVVNEIKCPDCGAWNPSTGAVDARCVRCSAHLEPERLVHAEEVKLAKSREKGYYLQINESDEQITQIYKIFVNSVRWSAYYTVMLFFVIVAGLMFLLGIIAI